MALAWEQNPDGAGFAWREDDGTVSYSRGFFDFRQFWKAYREHDNKDMLIHLRFATHGSKCLENCHPFVVADNVVMAHNGILAEFTGDKAGRSDSRVFAEDVLIPAIDAAGGWEALMTPAVRLLLERMIGYDKVVFLTSTGFVILNEEIGEWSESTGSGRIWWSAGKPSQRTAIRSTSFARGWEDEDEGNTSNWHYAQSTPLTGSYAEGSAEWKAFLEGKYGVDKIQMKYGMPLGSLQDQAEFRKTSQAMTIYNPITGSPQGQMPKLWKPPTAREALPDWVYKMAPNTEMSVAELEAMIERSRLSRQLAQAKFKEDESEAMSESYFDVDETDLRGRTMTDDEVIDQHIKARRF
jgi:hypothetical protein